MLSCERVLRNLDLNRYNRYEAFVEIVLPILSYQQPKFDTHAGETHIRHVIKNLDFLMPDKVKKKISSKELHLLLVAIWLHDIGKIPEFDSSKSIKKQLADHANKGFEYIQKYYASFHLDEKEGLIVAYIVRGHGLLDLSQLPEEKGLGTGDVINIRSLAAVLRLADELDIEYGRVPEIIKLVSGIKGIQKWNIRNNIDGVVIQSNTWEIIVHSTPKDYEILESIKKTVEWINSRLRDIKEELKKVELYYRTIDLKVDDIYLKNIQLKKKLLESEEKYRLITENIDDLIIVLNSQFEVTYLNIETHKQTLGHIFQYGKALTEQNYIHPDDLKKLITKMKCCIDMGEMLSIIIRIRHQNGSYFWFDIKGKTFKGENEEEKLLIMARDVTERKRAEQMLIESEKKYRNLFENSPNAIVLTNEEGIILDCNPATEKIFGFKENELIGKNYTTLIIFTSDQISHLIKRYKNFLQYKKSEPLELQISKKDASLAWICYHSSMIEISNEILIENIVQDITEKKKIEQKLKQCEENYRLILENATQKKL